MLTIFCTAKPFKGLIGVIQENALRSWTLLEPRPEIFLFGDGEGSSEIAKKLAITHIPSVAKTPTGLPLLNDMFSRAQALAANPTLCYLDADIILLKDVMIALKRVSSTTRPYMLIGCSWTVDQRSALDFQGNWEVQLKALSLSPQENKRSVWGIDYFAFPKGALPNFPPFAVGRPGWDAWLLYHVRSRGMRLIDASCVATVIHQEHLFEYGNDGGKGQIKLWQGADGRANLELVGDAAHYFSAMDITHTLTPSGLRPALGVGHLWRRAYTFPILNPRFRFLTPFLDAPLALTRPLRARIGLNMHHLSRRKSVK